MILNQYTITLAFAGILTLSYWCCSLRCKKHLKYDDLMWIGLMCAAVITGVFITIGAFKSATSSNAVYTGLLGITVSLVSAQKIITLFKGVLRKAESRKCAKAGDDAGQ